MLNIGATHLLQLESKTYCFDSAELQSAMVHDLSKYYLQTLDIFFFRTPAVIVVTTHSVHVGWLVLLENWQVFPTFTITFYSVPEIMLILGCISGLHWRRVVCE